MRAAILSLILLAASAVAVVTGSAQAANPVTAQSTEAPAIDIDYTVDETGYWVTHADGTVVSHSAPHFGDRPVLPVGEEITALAPSPSGAGYWLFSSRGRVFPFGDAPHWGDLSTVESSPGGPPISEVLNGPVVGSTATPTGRGYWMVASDGGIFNFGDAEFFGSMGGTPLNGPVVGLAPTPSTAGYWLVASDGGIFAFGDAVFYGSMGGTPLNRPVTSMIPQGDGYMMVASDGGIFNFGSSRFHGSLGGQALSAPIAGATVRNDLDGYLLVDRAGQVFPFGAVTTTEQAITTLDSTEPVIPATTEVLDETNLLDAIPAPSGGGTLVVADATNIQVGDIVVLGVTPETPEGFIGRVTDIEAVGESSLVTTDPASLVDAVPSGSITTPLTPASDGFQAAGVPGGGFLNTVECGGVRKVTVSFTSTMSTELWFEGEWNLFDGLTHLDLGIGGVFAFDYGVSGRLGLSCKLTVWRVPAEVILGTFVGAIGPVPVVATLTVGDWAAEIEGSISGGFDLKGSVRAGFDAGLRYTPETGFDAYTEPFFGPRPFSFDPGGFGTVRADFSPKAAFRLYGVTGFWTRFGPFIETKIDSTGDPWWVIDGGMEAAMGYEFDFKLIEFEAQIAAEDVIRVELGNAGGRHPDAPEPDAPEPDVEEPEQPPSPGQPAPTDPTDPAAWPLPQGLPPASIVNLFDSATVVAGPVICDGQRFDVVASLGFESTFRYRGRDGVADVIFALYPEGSEFYTATWEAQLRVLADGQIGLVPIDPSFGGRNDTIFDMRGTVEDVGPDPNHPIPSWRNNEMAGVRFRGTVRPVNARGTDTYRPVSGTCGTVDLTLFAADG